MDACRDALIENGIWLCQYPVPVEQPNSIGLVTKLTHVILEFELKKGIPLNYLDEKGQYTLRYPDGHTETVSLPETAEVHLPDNSV